MLRQVIIHSLTKSNATTALLNKCSTIHNHKCMLPLIQNLHTSNITSNHKHVTEQPQILTEEEYLMKTKAHPDVFGAAFKEEAQGDEGDKEEEAYFEDQPLPEQKLRTKQYADMIKELIRKRKIQEAIDVMEVRMIKEDRVKPEGYIYNLLMGACGRVGYTKKAFSLFNRMKQRGLSPMGGTYTALFNACANSPWQADGLSRATHLRNLMLEKGHEANSTTYNAMIKAFGRCGDLKTAFELVDEMVEKKLPTLENTFNFLLQASITDRDAGFRHALLVWRKMVAKNIRPTLYSYNLMLRSVRDCGLGDVEITKDVINRIVGTENVAYLGGESGTELLGSCDSEKQLQMPPTQITEINQPNLLAKRPHLGSIVSIAEIAKAEDRLLIVGGLTGFLNDLTQNECSPDVKTFTLLLDCIPSTLAAENELLKTMKKYKVKPDVDFCNMLIKKRSMRFDYENAKAVVNMLKEMNKLPNLMTYGVLALSCQTKQEAMELIEEMLQKKYRCLHSKTFFNLNYAFYLQIEHTDSRNSFAQCLPSHEFFVCSRNYGIVSG